MKFYKITAFNEFLLKVYNGTIQCVVRPLPSRKVSNSFDCVTTFMWIVGVIFEKKLLFNTIDSKVKGFWFCSSMCGINCWIIDTREKHIPALFFSIQRSKICLVLLLTAGTVKHKSLWKSSFQKHEWKNLICSELDYKYRS